LLDSLSPNERSRIEDDEDAATAEMDREDRVRRGRLEALQLSPREELLFQLLEGEEALSGDLDEGHEVDKEELIKNLYGVDWESLSRSGRRHMSARLRARLCSMNKKLVREGLRAKRSGRG
jgi:hypothetical protein